MKSIQKLHYLTILLFLGDLIVGINQVYGQPQILYQVPPDDMVKLVDAPPTPSIGLSPDKQWLLILDQPSLPSIKEVSQPELRIGGLRINPRINSRSRQRYSTGMRLMRISDKKEFLIEELPDSPMITNVNWSPDSKKLAFTLIRSDGVQLWYLDTQTWQASALTEPVLNDIIWGTYYWLPDSENIICKIIDTNRDKMPEESTIPEGPVIKENVGKVSPVRTYQDLLENPYDETLFEYFLTSQLVKIDLKKNTEFIGPKGIIQSFRISPDSKYILVQTIHKPFSYLVPYYNFPVKIDILDQKGNVVKTIADLPLADDIPKGFGSVRKGPRSVHWRSDASSELYWVQALDEGDASLDVEFRDQLFKLKAPFNGEAVPLVKFQLRYSGMSWGTHDLAIAYERWWKNRRSITSLFNPSDPGSGLITLFDRSTEDRYSDPGSFVMRRNRSGYSVLESRENGSVLYLRGRGSSPEGDKPFLNTFHPKTGKTKRLWQSEAPYYEYPIDLLDIKNGLIITRRESVNVQPNYYIRNLKSGNLDQITYFSHPHPHFSDIQKIFLKYYRKDGIQLTGTLYLPYKDEGMNKNLPVLMWAYPREFKDARAAGQVDDSPYRFDRISHWSTLIWLTQGYAVMDDPKMPIIGEGDTEPNDTYVEQLVLSAEAAIDTLVVMGVADPSKIAIGGHSYGAFMTANLLAHSDLFSAGIARSGAYNRTLTPFGFQAEERTFWEAPEIYFQMSPFMHADKINEPILLIHGEADNNSGTFPIQSQRFYHALKGHGATTRLVMLPHESHGYRARESILHMLWEMNEWMQKYVKME